ncbi:hypothetical protein V7S43_002095 [Phytophthora oleae]|uniref:RXLR phytopathogen effector protein WY-domain domain-containing protein n=1 Tax=Phytophthora oleae TaxID=2107226 RepID=A0ABD3G4E7_9STRA
MCRGLLPESPQLEYLSKLMAVKPLAPSESYRSQLLKSSEHRPWEKVFEMMRIQACDIEAELLSRSAPSNDIRSLLSKAFTKDNHYNRKNFVELLGLKPEYGVVREFGTHEFALLKQLRAEQLSAKAVWSDSEAVTTILYNCAVNRLDNRALNLRKRDFIAISKRLPAIDALLKTNPPSISQRVILTAD